MSKGEFMAILVLAAIAAVFFLAAVAATAVKTAGSDQGAGDEMDGEFIESEYESSLGEQQ